MKILFLKIKQIININSYRCILLKDFYLLVLYLGIIFLDLLYILFFDEWNEID